jgi:NEDD8-activating enzyme E1
MEQSSKRSRLSESENEDRTVSLNVANSNQVTGANFEFVVNQVHMPQLPKTTLDIFLDRSTCFGNETGSLPNGIFNSDDAKTALQKSIVLVIGAGGLGCEILKNLALSGIRDIHVIDMDNVDVTNLNRQFLFRSKDIGRPKAVVAAEFIMNQVPNVNITPYVSFIQDKDENFYRQFNVIIGGLDNLIARRWINSLLCSFVELDDDNNMADVSQIIPYIDGGTEGFKGQVRVILPRITSCFECSIDTFPATQKFAMCTLAETPRKPEHCIAYAMIKLWNEEFPERKLNKDSADDMQWIYQAALKRAKEYSIEGVTYMLTMGVVKNIIPAVASTNAVIAASCVLEAWKLLTFSGQSMNNYSMFMGTEGLYTSTLVYEKKSNCHVCSFDVQTLELPRNTTVEDLLNTLKGTSSLQLSNPSIRSSGKTLYMTNPPSLLEATKKNLSKKLIDFDIQEGDEILVTDPVYAASNSLIVQIKYTLETN